PFPERGAVDIGVDGQRRGEFAQRVLEADAGPARLGRGAEPAITGRARIDVDRAEAGDAERGDRAVPGGGGAEEGRYLREAFGRGARGDPGALAHGAAAVREREHELGAARLDGADQVLCHGPPRIV